MVRSRKRKRGRPLTYPLEFVELVDAMQRWLRGWNKGVDAHYERVRKRRRSRDWTSPLPTDELIRIMRKESSTVTRAITLVLSELNRRKRPSPQQIRSAIQVYYNRRNAS
jgi:hypothetical protein